MSIRKLTDAISVAGQIEPSDVEAIAEAGFRSMICNRPDGEEFGQPDFERIAEEARQHGLQIRFIPISSGAPVPEEAAGRFREALDELPAPVLAYCRSGTRCTALWSLAQAGRAPLEEIIGTALAAGYDMRGLAPRIAAAAGTATPARDGT